jgi:RimJ/RimL family protein N-acetyltransferase
MESRHWPLFSLRIRTPMLELRYPDDALLDALASLAALGVHDPDTTPFLVPWTDAPSPYLERGALQWNWRQRAEWTPERWECGFVAVVGGVVAGMQSVGAERFDVLREVHTGSWLGREFQRRGIGTEMRAAVLHFAFAGLGAEYATSGGFHDNEASLAVSRKLGYEEAGRRRAVRRDRADWMIDLRLDRDAWQQRQRHDIEIDGLEHCLTLFGGS